MIMTLSLVVGLWLLVVEMLLFLCLHQYWLSIISKLSHLSSLSKSESHIATDGRSVSLSWCWAPSGTRDQILVTVRQLQFSACEALSDKRTGLSFVSHSW
jgi:hypothetical protein